MTKLLSTLTMVVMGLVALAVIGPTLTRLISALVPLVLVVGVLAAILRVVWTYTRRW
jgi:hypothetical protein